MQAKLGDDGVRDLDELLAAAAVRCVAVDLAQAVLARDAFSQFGKGRAFSYALAKSMRRPLMVKY